MSPSKDKWDDEDGSSAAEGSGEETTIPIRAAATRRKFDDEEDAEEVLDSWEAAEDDSEVERKAKKAAEARAKDEAEAAAAKKSKLLRIAEHQAERARRRAEAGASSSGDDEEETEAERRERLRQSEKEADLKHAEDLFADVGTASGRKTAVAGAAVALDASKPHETVNLAALPLFNPTTKAQFEDLRAVLTPILASSSKKGHYPLFMQEFTKQLAKDLSSEQIKKMASTLTALSNERLKEEKAADKTTKKSKAAKTKTSLVTNRANATDVSAYDESNYADDDFM